MPCRANRDLHQSTSFGYLSPFVRWASTWEGYKYNFTVIYVNSTDRCRYVRAVLRSYLELKFARGKSKYEVDMKLLLLEREVRTLFFPDHQYTKSSHD